MYHSSNRLISFICSDLSNLSSITVTGGNQYTQIDEKGGWNDNGWNTTSDDSDWESLHVTSKYVIILKSS